MFLMTILGKLFKSQIFFREIFWKMSEKSEDLFGYFNVKKRGKIL